CVSRECDDVDITVFRGDLGEGFERRHLLDARRTSDGPEVEDHDAPATLAQLEPLSSMIDELKIGSPPLFPEVMRRPPLATHHRLEASIAEDGSERELEMPIAPMGEGRAKSDQERHGQEEGKEERFERRIQLHEAAGWRGQGFT